MGYTLRIIQDGAQTAEFNMTADRLLLDCAGEGDTIFLRTYSWISPTISLGCMQRPELLLDFAAMAKHKVSWITRPTGGRAVLHWDDLTYSCAFPTSAAGMGRSIAESYAVISRCLAAGLLHAGIATETHDSPAEHAAASRNLRLPCFCSPSRSELMVAGKKLVGSAQKRTGQAVLQHGSIPIRNHFRLLGDFMKTSADERASLRAMLEKKCICVGEIVPEIDRVSFLRSSRETLSRRIIEGFVDTLHFPACVSGWTEQELCHLSGS